MTSSRSTKKRKYQQASRVEERKYRLYQIHRYFLAHRVHPHALTVNGKTSWFILVRSDPPSQGRTRQFLRRQGMSIREHRLLTTYPEETVAVNIPPDISDREIEVLKKSPGRRGKALKAQDTFSLAPIEQEGHFDIQQTIIEFYWPEGRNEDAHTPSVS